VDVDPDVALVGDGPLAGVQAHPHPDWPLREGRLALDCRG
jgi:hypothetical protein